MFRLYNVYLYKYISGTCVRHCVIIPNVPRCAVQIVKCDIPSTFHTIHFDMDTHDALKLKKKREKRKKEWFNLT